jgi:radical SAM protein with 4Fe4S-binding SPASM domain
MSPFLKVLTKNSAKRFYNALLVFSSYYLSKIFHVEPFGVPISLSIEPTTACNLGCPECPSGLKKFTRDTGNLKTENLSKWLQDIEQKLWYINFYFQGEPFIHKDILDQIKWANTRGIYTSTSTNAHFIDEELARKIVESKLDQLIISLDGVTQTVYEKYRINGNLEAVLRGTKNIIQAKRNIQSKLPHVVFQFLVVSHNEHQIEEAKSLASEMGVDEIRFKTAQVYDFENGNELIPKNEKYSRYKKSSSGKWVIKNKLENHCWRMWSGSVITWNGLVVPCCFDKDAKHQLGDLKKSSFLEIWKSERYKRFRFQVQTKRKSIDICKNCSEGTKVWS